MRTRAHGKGQQTRNETGVGVYNHERIVMYLHNVVLGAARAVVGFGVVYRKISSQCGTQLLCECNRTELSLLLLLLLLRCQNMPLLQSVYKMYKMLVVASLLLRSRPSRYVAAATGATGASAALSSAELTPASTSRALEGRRCSGGITVRLDEVVCSSCCISASMASCLSWRFFPKRTLLDYKLFLKTPWVIHLLASRNIIVPHQIDQPQPTRQNSRQNSCDTPTMQLMTNEPMRARGPSCCEKRGTPMHRHSRPERIVPI